MRRKRASFRDLNPESGPKPEPGRSHIPVGRLSDSCRDIRSEYSIQVQHSETNCRLQIIVPATILADSGNMGLGAWLEGLCCHGSEWMFLVDGCGMINEAIDFASSAFDQVDMAADIMLEIRAPTATSDQLPFAALPECPLFLLLHSAIFEASHDYGVRRLYRESFKPSLPVPPAWADLGTCCSDKNEACHDCAPLLAQGVAGREVFVNMNKEAKIHTFEPAAAETDGGGGCVPALRLLPAAPHYKRLVWTVDPGEVEAARQLLKWCYSRQLSPEAASSAKLLLAVFDLSEKHGPFDGCSSSCVAAASAGRLPIGMSAADKASFQRMWAEAGAFGARHHCVDVYCSQLAHDFRSVRRDVIVELRVLLPPSAGGLLGRKGEREQQWTEWATA